MNLCLIITLINVYLNQLALRVSQLRHGRCIGAVDVLLASLNVARKVFGKAVCRNICERTIAIFQQDYCKNYLSYHNILGFVCKLTSPGHKVDNSQKLFVDGGHHSSLWQQATMFEKSQIWFMLIFITLPTLGSCLRSPNFRHQYLKNHQLY